MPFSHQLRNISYRVQKLPEYTISRFAPTWHYERRKKSWQERWANPNFDPGWKITNIPVELQEAVSSGWFPEGSAVLDIGCGDGQMTRWLDDQGFGAMGLDYSSPAVEKAKRTYTADTLKLSFQAVDVTQMPTAERKFDALFDRGCFHIIPENFAAAYCQGIASWANPSARFLLLATTLKGPRGNKNAIQVGHNWWINHIKKTFQDSFSIEKIEATEFIFNAKSGAKKPMPALAAWMIRR